MIIAVFPTTASVTVRGGDRAAEVDENGPGLYLACEREISGTEAQGGKQEHARDTCRVLSHVALCRDAACGGPWYWLRSKLVWASASS
jgi:hypothetical protein